MHENANYGHHVIIWNGFAKCGALGIVFGIFFWFAENLSPFLLPSWCFLQGVLSHNVVSFIAILKKNAVLFGWAIIPSCFHLPAASPGAHTHP